MIDRRAADRLVVHYVPAVTIQQAPPARRRAPSTLWLTVAFNLFALLAAIVLVPSLGDDLEWCVGLPIASLALSGGTGVTCLLRERTRPFGVGCLAGTAVAILAFVVLFAVFFVTYFIVPGGHQLS
jgi:hypothetical protein